MSSETTERQVTLQTRDRLLEAALAVFAENGFRGATVREICQRAGTNVAAINYHFGDKERLYAAAMRSGFDEKDRVYPDPALDPSTHSPEERFRHFVENFLLRILDDDPNSAHSRMVAREMIEPTPVLDELIEHYMNPTKKILVDIVSDLIPTPATPEMLGRIAMSVIGQIVFYKHCNAVVCKLAPVNRDNKAQIEALVDHIVEFSLGGIRALAKGDGQ